MPIKLNTASGGGVTLSAANTATDKTITVPADDGTMIYANSSGNVGIGTSSPSYKLEVANTTSTDTLVIKSTTDDIVPYLSFDYKGPSGGQYIRGRIRGAIPSNTGGGLVFDTGDSGSMTERARIDSSGNLLVNTTTRRSVEKVSIAADGASQEPMVINDTGAAGSHNMIAMYRTGGYVGGIASTATATQFNTTSDYRLKENVQPMAGALAKVAALKPCTYTWKADGSAGDGFIAHELQAVVPDAVTGEKDAVNEDGSIKPQGIDTSFLVATLTAALQEAHGLIKDLQSRVDALEAK